MIGNAVRAVVMSAPGRLEVREFPLPDPELGAVLMRIYRSRHLRDR